MIQDFPSERDGELLRFDFVNLLAFDLESNSSQCSSWKRAAKTTFFASGPGKRRSLKTPKIFRMENLR